MLVLSRKLDESIHIGSGVRVKVVGMKPGRVLLGIDAPPGEPILREELIPPESLADTVPAIPVVHDEAAVAPLSKIPGVADD